MYGTKPRYNRFLDLTTKFRKPRRKILIYLDLTKKCKMLQKIKAKQNFSTSLSVLFYEVSWCTTVVYRDLIISQNYTKYTKI